MVRIGGCRELRNLGYDLDRFFEDPFPLCWSWVPMWHSNPYIIPFILVVCPNVTFQPIYYILCISRESQCGIPTLFISFILVMSPNAAFQPLLYHFIRLWVPRWHIDFFTSPQSSLSFISNSDVGIPSSSYYCYYLHQFSHTLSYHNVLRHISDMRFIDTVIL